VYDIATCAGFHQLLVATLLAYGKALCTLHEAHNMTKSERSMTEDVVEKCGQVWQCGRLLWQRASSRMLRHHLSACRTELHLPINDPIHLTAYRHFTKFQAIESTADVNDPGSAEDEDVYLDKGETVYDVFLQWIRVQASYWLALDTLSRVFGSHDRRETVPEVYLVAVKHPNPEGSANEVEPWEITLAEFVRRCHSSALLKYLSKTRLIYRRLVS
jgi:hypothetical protein